MHGVATAMAQSLSTSPSAPGTDWMAVCQSGAWSYQGYSHKSSWAFTGSSDAWSFVGLDGSGNLNASPNAANGSISVNDVQIRSIGKTASQIVNPTITVIGWYGSTGAGAVGLGWWRYCWISGMNGGTNNAGVNPSTGSNGQGQYYWTVENHPTGSSNILVSCYN